jgi:Zn-dependent peptidase ImmA (M78 family)
MNPNVEISIFDVGIEILGKALKPGMESIQAQRDLDVRSIRDVPSALERAGYKISNVDLPVSVSGFSCVVDDTPHIVVNRAKSSTHTAFTIAHELGHHKLHLNPSGGIPRTQLSNSVTEFEANMFATMFVVAVTGGEQDEELLAQNPEIRSVLTVSAFGFLLAILVGLVIWICSPLFRTWNSGLIPTT